MCVCASEFSVCAMFWQCGLAMFESRTNTVASGEKGQFISATTSSSVGAAAANRKKRRSTLTQVKCDTLRHLRKC